MDVMGAMGLDEVRKTTGATDAGNGGDFLVPQTPLLDQFEIQGQHGEISAARTPGGMIGGNLLFGKPFPFLGCGNGGASLKAGREGREGRNFGSWATDTHGVRNGLRNCRRDSFRWKNALAHD
jgi:hypothetical protein